MVKVNVIFLMMICVFFKIFPELGHSAVKLLLESDYGCWSDFKYFCHFVLEHYPRCADLICTAIDIAIYNFDKDRYNWENAIMKYLKCVYGEPTLKNLCDPMAENICLLLQNGCLVKGVVFKLEL